MAFKPLELELNSWCKLQNSGFKLQKLHDFFYATFYKNISKTQGKNPNSAVQNSHN